MNPSGLCKCGCGGKTSIASCTYRKRGWVKGQHKDFIHGHHVKSQSHRLVSRHNFKELLAHHPRINRRSVSSKTIRSVADKIQEALQARRKRTQKQGPYKAGRTVMAQKAVGKIEAAMKRRG